jgi:hypothetical protein
VKWEGERIWRGRGIWRDGSNEEEKAVRKQLRRTMEWESSHQAKITFVVSLDNGLTVSLSLSSTSSKILRGLHETVYETAYM